MKSGHPAICPCLGTLTVSANPFQFTDINGASGIGFTVQFTATPEPATATLGLLSLAGLLLRRRDRAA